jgi:hypothetical protein
MYVGFQYGLKSTESNATIKIVIYFQILTNTSEFCITGTMNVSERYKTT